MEQANHSTTTGLIALPGLADALRQVGFIVLGGTASPADDVAEVRQHLDTGSTAPILVANPIDTIPGLFGFVSKTAPVAPVLLIDMGTPGPVAHDKALRLMLPTTLGELVQVVNKALPPASRAQCPPHLEHAQISADGIAAPVQLPDDSDTSSPWEKFAADDGETAAATVPAPTPISVSEPEIASPQAKEEHTPLPSPAQPAWMAGLESTTQPATPQPETPPTPQVHRVPLTELAPQPPAPIPVTPPAPSPPGFPPVHASIETPFSTTNDPSPGRGDVLIVTAGDGGATKTTTSRLLAQRATETGMRVVLIDGNGGQGDQRKILRITPSTLPSIYDYAVGATDARGVICPPDQVNQNRIGADRLDPVGFAAVLAPPADLADHSLVTPDIYRDVISEARKVADLVIVDTEKVEVAHMREPESFAARLIVPEMRDNNAWLLGVFDLDKAAHENMQDILGALHNAGTRPDRTLVMATLVPASYEFSHTDFGETFTTATLIGHTDYSDEMAGLISAGRINPRHPSVATGIDAVLHRITGRDHFSPADTEVSKGMMGRLFGRKGRQS